jgi:hypothetical protein
MTSWPKRIGNCKTVIESILNQGVKPDYIELNLSLEEFPNKESDLPQELLGLISNNKEIEINWVEGNDGVFKKIIPTLKKFYGEEYYLLSIDDDWIYRSDYVEFMVNNLKQFNFDTFCPSQSRVIGNRMIYKSSCFEPDFWKKLTQEVIDCRIDDMYIEYYLWSKHKLSDNFRPDDIQDMIMPYNQIFPNSHNDITGVYSILDIRNAMKAIYKIKFDNNA